MESITSRTSREVFQHHGEALMAGDLDGIVSDYSEDAIFVTPEGVTRGRSGIRDAFERLLGELPDADWEIPTQVYEDDMLLIEWRARSDSAASHVDDGIDTFVFREGLIRLQTVRYTLEPDA